MTGGRERSGECAAQVRVCEHEVSVTPTTPEMCTVNITPQPPPAGPAQ